MWALWHIRKCSFRWGGEQGQSESVHCEARFEVTTAVKIQVKVFWVVTPKKGVSKCFWTGHLEQELQMVQLSATRCSCIAIL